MKEYILLMHGNAPGDGRNHDEEWGTYIARLQETGAFQGGSSLGGGVCLSKGGASAGITERIVGYIRVQAESLERARELVVGNPVFEAGGTVEVRELVGG